MLPRCLLLTFRLLHGCLSLSLAASCPPSPSPPGYTPYEFIDFTDIALKHELVTKVDKPIRWAGWEGC